MLNVIPERTRRLLQEWVQVMIIYDRNPDCASVGFCVRGGAINMGQGPVIAPFLTDLPHPEDTHNMKLTTLKKLFKPSTVNISGSPIIDVAGDSHWHAHYGDKRISVHPSQAGKQLGRLPLRYVRTSSRLVCFPWPTISDRVSMGASYDSEERDPAPRCLPGTRKEVLQKIETWAKAGSEGKSVLWLHGPAGAGKSAIAQTVAETCAGRGELAASFFFSRTVAGRNSLKHLFPTIAVQIAFSTPEKRRRLDKILKNDPCIAERAMGSVDLLAALFEQGSALIPSSWFVVVIDGLDECQGHDDQCRILAQVARMINTYHLPLRFLIVSRPEAHLCEAFEEPDLANMTGSLSLYGDSEAFGDVSTYLKTELSRIYESKRHRDIMQFVPRPWPSEDIINGLVRKSEGYFIYASTVIKFIDEENFSPADRLDQILNISNSAVFPSDSVPFAELDKLYLQILSSCPTPNLPILKNILGFVVNHWGMDTFVIEALLRLPRGQVKLILRGLRSLVCFYDGNFPEDVWIRVNHASFGDFLHDQERSKHYHVAPDSEECMYTGFCDAFSLGCKMLGICVDGGIKSALRHRKGL